MEEDKLNRKLWIVPGVAVIRRDDISELNMDRLILFKMTVDKIVKRSVKDMVKIEGVRCHWIDSERKYQLGLFHTNELIPFDIAIKGISKVNKWINREKDGTNKD